MRLCHPPDGSTSPKYKLLCFITTKKNCKEKNALAFNQEGCCHLVLCLWLIPFHYQTRLEKACQEQTLQLNMSINKLHMLPTIIRLGQKGPFRNTIPNLLQIYINYRHHQQSLNQAGNACQGQKLTNINKLQT